MNKITSPEQLRNMRKKLQEGDQSKHAGVPGTGKVYIRVHMGTSGLASGAREIFEFFSAEMEKRNIDAVVIKTGDMGYCFAEPTIEVSRPGEAPVVFGNVDKVKADEIIQKYVKHGELVEGIIPVNYQTI
jgi:NADP-reducing hydrogenase subunit HndB